MNYARVFLILLAVALSGCATMQNAANERKGSAKEIEVSQTDRGALITVSENVLFDTGSSELRGGAKEVLDNLAKVINEKTKSQILIEGHTDNIGSKESNQVLSERRAVAVKKELVNRGVSEKRIQTKGLWFSSPKADNQTEEGRRQNRRTEILVLGEKKENLGANLEEILGNIWIKMKQFFS